jgi:uridine kinase
MEGIHCLNPVLTAQIPREIKFQIYISALTQLAIDHNSRISTTDNRLLRRLVRDRRFRGHSPLTTLRRWPSVQRGEQRWIFPFQHLADATFNSALDYELAVLKPYAVPLLTEIKPGQPEYAEARRLTGFLRNFMAIRPDVVPGDSILREYIGGSQLRY